ncbi:oxidoreductase [Exiguobacterium undae]|uniref:oxidoreductase n=1 Tax=Exiguobacterium undae TaxID=169177 RepID=UPI00047A6CA2|nr:oxidoreductase [Exiguobacterium undae]
MSTTSKVLFITGCSTGFGHQIAERAIKSGYRVVATARNVSQIETLTAGAEDRVLTLPLDVTDQDQITEAVAQSLSRFGRIDVLINNAGIGYFSSVEEGMEEETRKMFEINFWGLMQMTNAVLPQMRQQKSGHIINFSSIGGLVSFPTLGYYHATKYAVEGISESLAQEVSHLNINVTLVEPSGFRTDWSGRSSAKTDTVIPEYKEAIVGQMLQGVSQQSGQEPGNPEKAADAILQLVEAEQPPLRLLLGKAAYQAASHKLSTLTENIERWKETTLTVDFEN